MEDVVVKFLSEKISQRKTLRVSIYVYECVALLILFGIGSLSISGFASLPTLVSLFVLSSFLGIAAGGQTFVVVLGAIDLSIPSIIGVANVMVGQLSGQHWPFFYVALAIVLVAAVIGVINGLVSKVFSIHPLITTLATGSIAQGALYVWTRGNVTGQGPKWLSEIVSLNGKIGFIPLPPIVAVWAIYAILSLLLLYKTSWGKRLYTTGVNDRAARLALVNTTSIWVGSFILSAVSAALAGVLLAGFSGSAYFNVGDPYLFTTIGAVVVGGTSLMGGHGGYGRTILGALLLNLITTILIGYGFDSALQQAFLGFIIIFLLGFYGRQQDIRMRM